MTTPNADQRIRGLRPSKRVFDPYTPHGWLVEEERRPNEARERALTIFLTGAECAFTCSFCDLWQWTLDGPTPPGALVRQLKTVLATIQRPVPERIKLYNASNFFDRRAVPAQDLAALPALLDSFSGVTVESHASTITPRSLEFAHAIGGRLEVAIGLETVHPTALGQLNKRLDLERFDRASDLLAEWGIDLRVFVLLGAPHVPAEETVEWTVRTVEYAVGRGAAVVAIIPVRGGNGELERLESLGAFAPPSLGQLEEALDRCVNCRPSVVTADLWDAAKLRACDGCGAQRIDRLARMNLSGALEPALSCNVCGAR